MVHSDWGDWLPRAVEAADPDGLAVWYLGCNGLAVKAGDGTTLYVDPYLGTGDPPRTVRMLPVPFDPADVRAADAVFATHEHSDHVHGPSQAPLLAGTGATFHAPDASLAVVESEAWTDRWAVGRGQLNEVSEGDTVEAGGVTVHVETANDPDAEHPVSYVFEYGGSTLLHAGDSKPTPSFEALGERYDVDVGVLAFGSVGRIPDKETGELRRTKWYSDENEVVEAASALRVDRLVPTHWDMWKGLTADPTALHEHVRGFEHPRRLEVVEVGDRVDV